ncbi:hypothetical protein QYE76_042051 [Lolium multiflorum]|uniref:DUF4218 domain-containing protein n=1 Tax=Lolium multiflorum TaxID=4521 RepID=A0AAD8TGG7_LOLMU|nr:hypothetical protein QYE76_042051 [Lolium multiflorum]
MHITKNVCESLLGTLLNMPERTKDGPKARYDLLSIGIREELHAGRPDDDDDDDDDEAEDTQSRRKGKKAKKIEYYCPRVLHSKSEGDRAVFRLSPRSKTSLRLRGKISRLQEEIVVILCELEMYFPPAFFDVMVHLLVHIVEDIIQLGPTFLHSMMPFERMNGVIKGHLGKLAGWGHHEGSREMHVDFKGRIADFERANLVALQHIDVVDPWVVEHKTFIAKTYSDQGKQRTDGDIIKEHNSTFTRWFKDKMLTYPIDEDSSAEEKLILALSQGAEHNLMTFQAYDINGYTFYTEEKDMKSDYQNSGVTMESYTGDIKQRYYGKIEEIWELSYAGENVPMFRVRWAKNVVKEDRHFTTMVIPEAKIAGAKVTAKYEPWVLASQVDQCFFITDPQKPNRVVVRRGKRSIIGMDGAANELDFDQPKFPFSSPVPTRSSSSPIHHCALLSAGDALRPFTTAASSPMPPHRRHERRPPLLATPATPSSPRHPGDALLCIVTDAPSILISDVARILSSSPRSRSSTSATSSVTPFELRPIELLANPVLTCATATDAGYPSNFVANLFLYVQLEKHAVPPSTADAATEDRRRTCRQAETWSRSRRSTPRRPRLLTPLQDLTSRPGATPHLSATPRDSRSNMANNEEAGGSGSKPFWMLTDEMEVMESQPRRDDGEDDGTDPEYRADDAAEDDTTDGAAEDDTTDGAAEDDTGAPKKLRRERRPNVLSTVKQAFTEVSASGHPTAPPDLVKGYSAQLGCILRSTVSINTENLRHPDRANLRTLLFKKLHERYEFPVDCSEKCLMRNKVHNAALTKMSTALASWRNRVKKMINSGASYDKIKESNPSITEQDYVDFKIKVAQPKWDAADEERVKNGLEPLFSQYKNKQTRNFLLARYRIDPETKELTTTPEVKEFEALLAKEVAAESEKEASSGAGSTSSSQCAPWDNTLNRALNAHKKRDPLSKPTSAGRVVGEGCSMKWSEYYKSGKREKKVTIDEKEVAHLKAQVAQIPTLVEEQVRQQVQHIVETQQRTQRQQVEDQVGTTLSSIIPTLVAGGNNGVSGGANLSGSGGANLGVSAAPTLVSPAAPLLQLNAPVAADNTPPGTAPTSGHSISCTPAAGGASTLAELDAITLHYFYMRAVHLATAGDRAVASEYLKGFFLANQKYNLLLPVFPEDNTCTLISVTPRHSMATYLDADGKSSTDYTNVKAVLDDALNGYVRAKGHMERPNVRYGKHVFKHQRKFPCVKKPPSSTKDAYYALYHMNKFIRDQQQLTLPEHLRDWANKLARVPDDGIKQDFFRIQTEFCEIIHQDVIRSAGEFYAGYQPSNSDIDTMLQMQGDDYRSWMCLKKGGGFIHALSGKS